jgi:hypothetical protein
MKKWNFEVMVLTVLALFCACKKNKETEATIVPAAPYQADTALLSTIYGTYANFMVSDIEMVCSSIGENSAPSNTSFYSAHPSSSGTITVIRNNLINRVSVMFNQTICNDGRVRNGSLYMFYKEQVYAQHPLTGNENYIRDYNFTGRITLEEYSVDGWLVDEVPLTVFIHNLRPNSSTPINGNLRWLFMGDFKMKKGQDSLTWKGSFTKTLENTSDSLVFNPLTYWPINWNLALIAYSGLAIGTTLGNVAYTYEMDSIQKVKRDFFCRPDAFGSPSFTGFHPFVSGKASFTTAGAHQPRKISFEINEDELPPQCDNLAIIEIGSSRYTIAMQK